MNSQTTSSKKNTVINVQWKLANWSSEMFQQMMKAAAVKTRVEMIAMVWSTIFVTAL